MQTLSPECLNMILEMAEHHLSDYLADGDSALDFGDEWPSIANKWAEHCREIWFFTLNQSWNELALRLEEKADGYEKAVHGG